MTTIAAICIGDEIAIASDGACSRGGETVPSPRRVQKIKTWGHGVAIGVAGDLRVANLVCGIPIPPSEIENTWVAVKSILQGDGITFTPNEAGAATCGSEFIIVANGVLYEVDGSGGMYALEKSEPAAIGSGAAFALGAMDYMMASPSLTASDVVGDAVRCAIRRDPWTGGDVYVAKIKIGEKRFSGGWI